MKRVLIVQRVLPHYRVAFFEQLRHRLADEGVVLDLAVGQPTRAGGAKKDGARLDWALELTNRYIPVGRGGKHLVWQPVWRLARRADLVIVEQASRLLVNYLLLLTRHAGGPRVAFWGHGENLDKAAASRFGESIKRKVAPRADWWFGYTQGTADRLAANGVRVDRVTVVKNSVDVRSLQEALASVSAAEKQSLRESLGISDGTVAMSLGSIYPSKRPEYLIEAADRCRQLLTDFHLIVAGEGPQRGLVDSASVTRDWVHPVGMLTGRDLARHAALASVLMNPGLVGLAVLDAFALQLPMITCDLELHSPEIEYLKNGYNGIILPADTAPTQFAESVINTCSDPNTLEQLRTGCVESAQNYSIEKMVNNFADGILSSLST